MAMEIDGDRKIFALNLDRFGSVHRTGEIFVSRKA